MDRSVMQVAIGVCAVAAFASALQNGNVDEWRLRATDDPERVHLSIERARPGSRWMHSSDVRLDRFRGLSMQALKSGGPAKFEYVGDAAKLVCDGAFTNGRGIGTFQLIANPQYGAELQRLGYDPPADTDLFTMLMADVSLEFARGVKDARVAATTKQLAEMRIHGVTLDYIRQMQANGYTTLTPPEYVEMRVHGVTPEFVSQLKKAGYDVPARKVIEMRIHGVTTAYINELTSYGLKPTASEIVELRIHGVQPDYLRELKQAGLATLPVRELLNMRIHGVSSEFVRETKQLGYNFSGKELTDMRIHGVDGAYLKKLRNNGLQNLTADKIVSLRIHGVD